MDAGSEARFAVMWGGRSDRFYLLLLLALVLPLRAWLPFNTEVTARDSIGYIRYALEFETKDWGDLIRSQHQHPGYAFSVWLLSVPLRVIQGTDPYVMRFAAQGVSTLASLLLLFPMFYLGKELLGPRIAFWGTLLFQFLPVSGHHLSDGISESVFLLLTTTALWQAVVAFRPAPRNAGGDEPYPKKPSRLSPLCRSCLAFALCGLFGGLAYWTRPEGAFVVAAAGLVLLGRQFFASRASWKIAGTQGVCLAFPALILAGAFVWITGEITRKMAPRFMIGQATMTHLDSTESPEGPSDSPSAEVGQTGRNRAVSSKGRLFASFIIPAEDYPTRFQRAARTFVMELSQGFHYLGGVAVLFGIFWYFGYLCRSTGFWMLIVLGLIQSATLFLLAVRAFYISDRHVMVLVLPGCFLMAAGLLEIGRRLQEWLARTRLRSAFARWSMPTIVAAAMLVYCLPKTLQRMHGNRVGNHHAGVWLKEHLKEGDLILDDHCWSHYYAGHVFLEGREPTVAADYVPTSYVVMTRSKILAVDETRRNEEQRLKEEQARIVYHWPPGGSQEKARVVVYALPRDFQKNPWKVAALK